MTTKPCGQEVDRPSLAAPAERLAWATVLACSLALALAFWATVASACLAWRVADDARRPTATIVLAPPAQEVER